MRHAHRISSFWGGGGVGSGGGSANFIFMGAGIFEFKLQYVSSVSFSLQFARLIFGSRA